MAEGFAPQPDLLPPDTRLDEVFAPDDLVQVVDADSSQTLIIEAVRRGANLVVQGPPGTGKSQTITNIIAAAVHDKKRVLFVAEKMAALDVVHSRLQKTGLGALCLELHSNKANKRALIDELGRTLLGRSERQPHQDAAKSLQAARDWLNRNAEKLHEPIGRTGFTLFQAMSAVISGAEANLGPFDMTDPGFINWDHEQFSSALSAATSLGEITAKAGPLAAHPFHGARTEDLLPMDVEKLRSALKEALGSASALVHHLEAPARHFQHSGPLSLDTANRFAKALEFNRTIAGEARAIAASIAKRNALDFAKRLLDCLTDIGPNDPGRFSSLAASRPVDPLRRAIARGATLTGRLFSSEYKAASMELQSLLKVPLPKSAQERLELVEQIALQQDARNRLKLLEPGGIELLGHLWNGENTLTKPLREAVTWLEDFLTAPHGLTLQSAGIIAAAACENLSALHQQLADNAVRLSNRTTQIHALLGLGGRDGDLSTSLMHADIRPHLEQMQTWLDNIDRLDEWARLKRADETLRKLGLSELCDALARGDLEPTQAAPALRYSHGQALYRAAHRADPSLQHTTAQERAQWIERFKDLEHSQFAAAAERIKAQHAASIPKGSAGAMGIVRGEIGKKRGHRPIRWLIKNAGPAIQELKPIFLMSPISIAQFLEPGAVEFDLVVMDEASQIRPEEALGAVARSKQLVVVGDSKQLPPTSFFDRATDENFDDEEDDEGNCSEAILLNKASKIVEYESILKLCEEGKGMPSKRLRWHYRSKHPSLIEVSNDEFYERDLIFAPAPFADRGDMGLHLERVAGVYDRGGKRHNLIEARAVVDAVACHASKTPHLSLGVVTFSTSQRDLLTLLLEEARRADTRLDLFLREGKAEDFFVKNLENVQGDERDVIFVSVGYGPSQPGAPLTSMAFGPVSREGGERRLNVLFTRAKRTCRIFCSFSPSDINPDRARNSGARVLRRFLDFAETGILETAQPTGREPDSEFEVSVANAIRMLGYEVDYQVGASGFRIDLAVRDRENRSRYILAVECDGAAYHSALWARERDRQRQFVLEAQGWRFHRVWSTDWFHRKLDELRRLKDAIDTAQEAAAQPLGSAPPYLLDREQGTMADPHTIDDQPVEASNGDGNERAEFDRSPGPIMPPYRVADFDNPHFCEPHELSPEQMAQFVHRIIKVEGPIHVEELARRVAGLFGKKRSGGRILDNCHRGLERLQRTNPAIRTDRGFWFTREQAADPMIRDRRDAPAGVRRADQIAPIEIAAAIRQVLGDNGAVPETEIARLTAGLMGFQRTGPDLQDAIVRVIAELRANDELCDGPAGVMLHNSGGSPDNVASHPRSIGIA